VKEEVKKMKKEEARKLLSLDESINIIKVEIKKEKGRRLNMSILNQIRKK